MGVVWRYLMTGNTVHALASSGDRVAVCGRACAWFDHWRGTGNQDEYEHAATLRECKRCVAKVGPREKGDG